MQKEDDHGGKDGQSVSLFPFLFRMHALSISRTTQGGRLPTSRLCPLVLIILLLTALDLIFLPPRGRTGQDSKTGRKGRTRNEKNEDHRFFFLFAQKTLWCLSVKHGSSLDRFFARVRVLSVQLPGSAQKKRKEKHTEEGRERNLFTVELDR